jgi:hypothetical protein
MWDANRQAFTRFTPQECYKYWSKSDAGYPCWMSA